MKTFLWVFTGLLFLPFAPAAIFLGVMGIYSGWSTPEATIQWIINASPWIVTVSSFTAGLIVSSRDRHKLLELSTPSVSLDLFKEIQEDIEGVQRAFLEVTGLSANKVKIEVFGTDVRANTPTGYDIYGRFILHIASGVAQSFSVHRGETHRSIPIIRYNPCEGGPSIHVEIPLQIPTTDIIRGDEFVLSLSAFGGTKPASMTLRFGVDYETRRLWVQKEGSTERLVSRALEASPRQIDEQMHKGYEEG